MPDLASAQGGALFATIAAAPGAQQSGSESPGDTVAEEDVAGPRIVLDTNVCLDLLLFADPRCEALRSALQASAVHAVTNESCRAEWLRVLCYPQLCLEREQRAALSEAFDALMHRVAGGAPLRDVTSLPRCGDPDDQKFMELAAISGARWLLSRDRDLLALGRRTAAAGLFSIVAPQDWSGVVAEQ